MFHCKTGAAIVTAQKLAFKLLEKYYKEHNIPNQVWLPFV